MLIDFVGMELRAELQSVRADDFGQAVAEIVGVVNLRSVGDRDAHDEGGKGDVLDAFELRRLHIDSRRSGAGNKALRGKAYAEAALGLPDDIGIAQIAEMKLVDGIRADQFVIAQREQLRAPDIQSIEAGYAGPGDRAWIRIVEVIVVDEVIARDLAQIGCSNRCGLNPCCLATVWANAEVEYWLALTLGDGMYCNRFLPGADHALCGMTPPGKTLVYGSPDVTA